MGMLNSMWNSVRKAGSPSVIAAMSALVPPMSSEIALGSPSRSATARAPITPAAGPDWQMRAGRSQAEETVISPPPEWLTSSSPSSRSAPSSPPPCSRSASSVR